MPQDQGQLSDLSDLVGQLEGEIKEELDNEEKRLLQERDLLKEIYTQVVGEFTEKSATDLTTLYVVSLVRDLAPDVYAAIKS